MNQKHCKKLRQFVRGQFPKGALDRQLIYQALGKKTVTVVSLDEHGKRTSKQVQMNTGRMVNNPKSARGFYRHLKRLDSTVQN